MKKEKNQKSQIINNDKCIEFLIRLYCFQEEIKGKMKNFENIKDNDKCGINFFFRKKNYLNTIKLLYI